MKMLFYWTESSCKEISYISLISENFGVTPYVIPGPVTLKICKVYRRTSIFKVFELMIEGEYFSDLANMLLN